MNTDLYETLSKFRDLRDGFRFTLNSPPLLEMPFIDLDKGQWKRIPPEVAEYGLNKRRV